MAETKKAHRVYINQDTGKFETVTGSTVGVAKPDLFLGNYFIFQAAVRNDDGSPFEFPIDAVFFAALNADLGQNSPDEAASIDGDFNDPLFWDEISLPGGKIAWEMNTLSQGMVDYLGTDVKKQVWIELWFKEPDSSFSKILHERLWIYNSGTDFVAIEVPDPANFYTKTETDALLAGSESRVLSVASFEDLPTGVGDGAQVRINGSNLIATYRLSVDKWFNALGGEVTAEG